MDSTTSLLLPDIEEGKDSPAAHSYRKNITAPEVPNLNLNLNRRRKTGGITKKVAGRLVLPTAMTTTTTRTTTTIDPQNREAPNTDSSLSSPTTSSSTKSPAYHKMPKNDVDDNVEISAGSRHFGFEPEDMDTTSATAEHQQNSGGVYFSEQTTYSKLSTLKRRSSSVPSVVVAQAASHSRRLPAIANTARFDAKSQDTIFNSSLEGEGSITKTASLQRISIEEARGKSYLIGNASRNDFVSGEELEKLFPDRNLYMYIACWNLAGKDVPVESLKDWILAEEFTHTADLYAIGVQEAPTNSGNFFEWEAKLQQCLLGCKQVLFHSVWLGVQHLVIFVRRELIWYLSRVDDFRLSTRAMSNVRTKGALAIAFKLFGTSFLFISSHLAYGADPNVRVRDYHKIVKSLYLKNFLLTAEDVLTKINYVFWFGDLNFRLDVKRNVIENAVERINARRPSFNFEVLFQNDQLLKERKLNRVFGGFSENNINFLPTYKYDIGTNNFDTSAKNRVPAYTDRILFRNNTNDEHSISNLAYNSVTNLCFSDHKPVYGLFVVALKPGKDNPRYVVHLRGLFLSTFFGGTVTEESACKSKALTSFEIRLENLPQRSNATIRSRKCFNSCRTSTACFPDK